MDDNKCMALPDGAEPPKYTAEWIREQAAGAIWLDHHDCSICGVMVGYELSADAVYFQPGCGCDWSPRQPRSWQDIASWLAMQRSDDVRDLIMAGLKWPRPADAPEPSPQQESPHA